MQLICVSLPSSDCVLTAMKDSNKKSNLQNFSGCEKFESQLINGNFAQTPMDVIII